MKKYSSECFVVIFFSFYFLNALQSDINSNRVYVLGYKYVLGPSQTHFSPRLAARAKMSLSRAQNIFTPANINSIVILLRLLIGLKILQEVQAVKSMQNQN